jgi:FtsP/CotA-like multicopper oxidase with cupredoxin domain
MPPFVIPREALAAEKEAEWVKSFAPPQQGPATPDEVVPNVVIPLKVSSGVTLTMWDGTSVDFMTIEGPNTPGGRFPAETLRVNRGQVVHSPVNASFNTHTIHWHGIEPTPMNDGVGHTSFEAGNYTYQWQPNYIGSFVYHCHKNTVLHFEWGMYGVLIIDPPTGRGRTEANVPGFPGFDPATYTVPYDVEAIWVADDVDPVWHNTLGHNAFMASPGVDGPFTSDGILHDFNPKYFFMTGFNLPAPLGGSASVPADHPGVDGAQVAIRAGVNQNVLVRIENAAYGRTRWRLNGLDATVIAADGRSFGVPPHGKYNAAFTQPADIFFELSTAQRWDLLIRTPASPGTFSATVEFRHYADNQRLFTATIPITVLA